MFSCRSARIIDFPTGTRLMLGLSLVGLLLGLAWFNGRYVPDMSFGTEPLRLPLPDNPSAVSSVVTEGPGTAPSHRRYGGARWWLALEPLDASRQPDEWEMFACRRREDGTTERVQLTAVCPDIVWGTYRRGAPRWSKDDAFILATAYDTRDESRHLFRLPIGGGTIEDLHAQGRLPLTVADLEPMVSLPPGMSTQIRNYCWSPDGSEIAYLLSELVRLEGRRMRTEETVCVKSLETGRERLVLTLDHVNRLRWSRDGTRLIVRGEEYTSDSHTAGVWILKRAGSHWELVANRPAL